MWMGVGCPCPPVRNDIVTPRHLLSNTGQNCLNQIDDEKSPEFQKYVGLVRKFVVESNAISHEKAMEATLVYVENAAMAGKIAAELVSGIVTKCLNSPRCV